MNNSNRNSLVLAVAVILSVSSYAQKKQFTIAEATNGMATTLAPKSIKNPSWQPGTDNFWQVEKRNDQDLLTMTDCAEKEKKMVNVESGNMLAGATATTAFKWLDKDHVTYTAGKSVIIGTLADNKFTWGTLAKLPGDADHITVDKSRKIAYTIDNNLWLWDNGKVQVTQETDKNIICGQSVHRDEFGIDGGIFFSPKGNLLAYYRMDQTMVKDYPIIKWDTVPATVSLIKYPMAGGASHEVTLCVYNPATGKSVTMKTGDANRDHYLTCVTWDPSEKYIYIAILNRGQDHLWLNKYNAATGEKVQTLIEETSPKYVHPTHSLVFLPWNNNQFIWWSERDGYQHLYLYNTNGDLIHQVTRGRWVVNEMVGFNKSHHKIIFTSSKESPLEKRVYSVSLDDGKMDRVDENDSRGMHTALCSEDGEYIFDVYNGTGIPKNSVIRATNNYQYRRMLLNAPDPLSDYERPIIKDVTIFAADGITPLYGKKILPTNFDPGKKYPVIVYLYNGPNVQLIHNSFPESGNLWYEYMAQHGYIVLSIDGRGSWNRGVDFEQASFRRLGDAEMADQLQGVAYLKSLPYVDAGRIGVFGWSFGGFMTTSLMLKHPGVFKCAVAGGPVMDWKMYEVMYTERYMDMPQDNPKGYENANLLDKVKNLKGRLMLIHGTNDNVVVWQHSIDFLKKCVDENVQIDYFVYPGYEHNVRGKDRVHLMQKISNYFDQNLKQ